MGSSASSANDDEEQASWSCRRRAHHHDQDEDETTDLESPTCPETHIQHVAAAQDGTSPKPATFLNGYPDPRDHHYTVQEILELIATQNRTMEVLAERERERTRLLVQLEMLGVFGQIPEVEAQPPPPPDDDEAPPVAHSTPEYVPPGPADISGASASNSTSGPSSPTTGPPCMHPGEWAMDKASAEFFQLPPDIRDNFRKEKQRRLATVISEMKWIIDDDEISSTTGTYTCCGASSYKAKGCQQQLI